MSRKTTVTIDLYNTAPYGRQALVFERFRQLGAGEYMLLVDDQDPRPILCQLRTELGDDFFWDFLEMGPTYWRVKIGKAGNTC
jgi:regulator of cell morphogenesis and NO signaling